MAGTSTEVKRLEEYIDQSDWRVKANANQGYSVGGAILNVAGGAAAGFWFKQYGDEIANLHKDGDFYIHDLDYVSGYCCGHSLRSLLLEGFNGVEGKISSNPPKHLSSALNQMVNFLGTLQNEWAGAQAFSSVDTLLAPYVWIEREDIRKEMQNLGADVDSEEAKQKIEEVLKKRVHQLFQELIFNLSVSSRWGNQTVFSNFSFDIKPPKDLADKNPIVGGEPMNMVYADFQKEMDLINITFCDVMYEGDRDGRIFSFPIPTYSMTKDFPYYSEVGDAIFKLTAKYGSPYFANYTNTTMSPEDARSMCPLTGDTKVLVRTYKGTDTIEISKLFGKCEETPNFAFEVWDGEKWCNAKPNYQGVQKYLIIKMDMGEIVKMGLNHIQCLSDGTAKLGSELKIGDEIPFIRLAQVEHKCLVDTVPCYGSRKIASIQEAGDEQPLYCMEVQNDNHLFTLANGILTHNCRLRLDLRELKRRGGGLFGSSEQTGSIGVVTLNMARIGALYKTKEEMYKRIDYLMDMAKTSLLIKRKVITDLLERGFYPYTKRYLGSFKNFFNTIGVNGMNEMVENMTDKKENITTEFGQAFCEETLKHINDNLLKYQQESDTLWNMEATPAEGCFAGDTKVVTTEGVKRMDEIVGRTDIGVLSYNEKTHKREFKTPDWVRQTGVKRVLKVTFDNGQEVICTGNHPFAVFQSNNESEEIKYVAAQDLKEGMMQSNHIVKSVEWLDYEIPVYNMEIPVNHNYFVGGDKGVLVHNCTYKLAMSDKKKYGSEYVYYTNSSQLPTGFTDDPFLAIKMQENLQSLYTGGTVLHLYLSRALGNTETQSRDLTRELIRRAMVHSKLPYVSATPVFSVCPEHGYIYGESPVCPKCGKKTEVWSRVMGYYRPRDSYNIGKRYEHDHKKLFDAELTQKELEVEKDEIVPMKTVDGQFIDKHAA